ncbi:MAG: hypothetical protein RLZZ08_991 [Pseudomonadota bacterium]
MNQPTRLKLLIAAETVILSDGVTGLTVRRVGEVSGLNPTLITYHFGTMARLLDELCDRNLAPMLAEWADLQGQQVTDPHDVLRRWLTPLLARAAFAPHGRALVVLDEIASHGEEAVRERLFREMAGVARRVRQSLAPHLPHLGDDELASRLRFIAGAALGPPPRSRTPARPAIQRADQAELDLLCRFAASGLELPPPSR